MKKADGWLISFFLILSVVLLIPLFNKQDTGAYAVVKVRNEEKMRLDLSQDGEYEVEGALGPVHIIVRDRKVKVSQENSPHHYCSKQGFVDNGVVPIVCLPNETVITIEDANSQPIEDTVIQ
ncbi:MAG: NusG domain II-containing protein [Allobaculum sp.]